MSGFKNEKEMWKYQKPRLRGYRWQRYELVEPAGHPDVKGCHRHKIIYIENKIGDFETPESRRKSLNADQHAYLNWLDACEHDTYVCFGSKKAKSVTFYPWRSRLMIPCCPDFWTLDKSE